MSCLFTSTGAVTPEDQLIFSNTAPRRRRQAGFAPVFFNEFNYTDEQIAFCENDQACLFDLLVTGDDTIAMTALESGKNFSKQVRQLSK